jgi:HEAT repeat protein
MWIGRHFRRGICIVVLGALFFLVQSEGKALADRVDDLIAELQAKNTMERRQAAHDLGKLKDPRSVGPLISALNDKEPMVRLDVSGALIEIGEPVVNPLIQAVKTDDNSIFLWNAIRVLEEIGDPKAIDTLKSIEAKHTDPSIQQISKYALEKLQRGQKP